MNDLGLVLATLDLHLIVTRAKVEQQIFSFEGYMTILCPTQTFITHMTRGNYLILQGGDHFDIHYDTLHLKQRIPVVLNKLRMLLRDRR